MHPKPKQKCNFLIMLASLSKILVPLILFSQIAGCTSLYHLTEEEQSSIMTGEKALVLIRVKCIIDSQLYEPFSSSLFNDNVTFGLGTFETVGEPIFVSNRYFSDESRRAGWTYLLLQPGTYYLTVRPPQRSNWKAYEAMLKTGPRWRIDIPSQTRLLYVGTISFTGQGDPLLFGGVILRAINDNNVTIEDDQELASKLLSTYYPGAGGVKTIFMQRWKPEDSIIIRSTPPAAVN